MVPSLINASNLHEYEGFSCRLIRSICRICHHLCRLPLQLPSIQRIRPEERISVLDRYDQIGRARKQPILKQRFVDIKVCNMRQKQRLKVFRWVE